MALSLVVNERTTKREDSRDARARALSRIAKVDANGLVSVVHNITDYGAGWGDNGWHNPAFKIDNLNVFKAGF